MNEETWLSDRAEIGGSFVSHFSSLFSSSRPPTDEDMSSVFAPAITEEDNLFLCSIPPKAEVVQALSSLVSIVTPPNLALANPVESLAIHPVEPTCGQMGNRPYKNCQSKCKEGE
jgi:hypothetical protein